MIARKIKEMHDSEQNPAGENEMNIHPCSCLDEVCVCVWGGGGGRKRAREAFRLNMQLTVRLVGLKPCP